MPPLKGRLLPLQKLPPKLLNKRPSLALEMTLITPVLKVTLATLATLAAVNLQAALILPPARRPVLLLAAVLAAVGLSDGCKGIALKKRALLDAV